MNKETLPPEIEASIQALQAQLRSLQIKANEHAGIRATLMINFGPNRPQHPDGVAIGDECSTHDAVISVLRQYHEKLVSIRQAIEAIVIPRGDDAGVLLVSSESPTTYKEGLGQVYDKEYFSDMGEALVSLWKMTSVVVREESVNEQRLKRMVMQHLRRNHTGKTREQLIDDLSEKMQMNWNYESAGVWVAASHMTADDAPRFWRVNIEKTGLFSAGQSDSELDASNRQFTTHHEATHDCELREMTRINGERKCACGLALSPGVDDVLCMRCYKTVRRNSQRC
jgi:hypothetical protein